MEMPDLFNPADLLSRAERRQWRRRERRIRHEHEAEQLATLMGLAATGGGITGLTTAGSSTDLCSHRPSLIIEGRRLRAARVHRPTLTALEGSAPYRSRLYP